MAMISVVLPVHNGENYIGESLKSVLSQSFRDFELIIVDDCSSDRTAEICRDQLDPRIKYVRNDQNKGVYEAVNIGFRQAACPLVFIWSHDDVMLPNCLERFWNCSLKYPEAAFYYCGYFAIDSVGARTGAENQYGAQRSRTPALADPETSALLFLCFGCLPGSISTVMMKKEVWANVGGFDSVQQHAADYAMWLKASRTDSVAYIDQKLVEIRYHPSQASNAGRKQMVTVGEEYEIYRELRERLVHVACAKDIYRFWREQRGRQHAHWLLKALLAGSLDVVQRGWVALAEYGNPWLQIATWAVTLNGRRVRSGPERFFDQTRGKLKA